VNTSHHGGRFERRICCWASSKRCQREFYQILRAWSGGLLKFKVGYRSCPRNYNLIVDRPPANKPKPNTRFLRNIIKDTDTHNAALLAKEAAESRARLQSLSSNGNRTEKATRIGGGDIRKRQLGAIAAILGDSRPTKRRRPEDARKDKQTTSDPRRADSSTRIESPKEKSRSERRGDREFREDRDQERRDRGHKSHRKHRSMTPDRDEDREDHKRRRRSRSRSPRARRSKDYRSRRSPDRRRSRSPDRNRDRGRDSGRLSRSPRRRSTKEDEKAVKAPEPKPDYDSDPLDEIIGPRPPPVEKVRTRGRGTISHESGIDSRFSSKYDPTIDVQLDPDEENDWDQALEALRDRQKWKQQGADRLKAAGFTDEEVRKWEKGGEKNEEDVKWAKKGEGREWDRGKVFDADGGISFEPQFGRLKDT
jgi:hypothetical protein